jgi:hypothetical protein
MKIIGTFVVLSALLAGVSTASAADDQGSKAAIQKQLESEYAITKPTDDKTDIVTAGAVLVLQKDKLMMVAASSRANPCPNTYKDGRLTPNSGCKTGEFLRKIPGFGSRIPGADKAPATRTFVSGEKFWVTKIDVTDTGIAMELFSDAINDVRFRGSLTIPFKDGIPSPEDALKLVQEVVKTVPSEDAKGDAAASSKGAPAAAPASATEAAPPPIEAPPPPPDEPAAPPPTVSLGQTTAQVEAILGPPLRKAKVGIKDIYSYKDLKVTFVNGKVKDIQ